MASTKLIVATTLEDVSVLKARKKPADAETNLVTMLFYDFTNN
jgi:hypothetical protein